MTDSDAPIGKAFRRGSSEAVSAVQDRVRRIVGFRGYRMPAADKKDLEQEIMTQIWQAANRAGFDAGDRFWGFVEVVTARRCIDWLRGRVRVNRETELHDWIPDAAPSPLSVTLERERRRVALEALESLGEPCKELLSLHFGLGKSYRDLTTVFGKSEGALRVQVHRCIARLQELVQTPASETVSTETTVHQ